MPRKATGEGAGRHPQSDKITVLKGNQPKNKNSLESQIDLPVGCDMPPEVQGIPRAKDEWERIYCILEPIGLLTQLDRTLLSLYCITYAQYLDCIDAMTDSEGNFCLCVTSRRYKNSDEEDFDQVKHPLAGVYNQLAEKMMQLLQRLGLTPTDRAKLKLTSPKEEKKDDPKAKYR